MIKYLTFGETPSKRHSVFYKDQLLMNEYCFTRGGFEDFYSILYLVNPPTSEANVGLYAPPSWTSPKARAKNLLRRRHFLSSGFESEQNFIEARSVLAFNEDLIYALCRPKINSDLFFANNDGDELFFVLDGEVLFQSLFGKILLKVGDYLIVPKSCPYRFQFLDSPRLLAIEAKAGLSLPAEFRNANGQLKMDAPYSERSFSFPEWDTSLFEGTDPVSVVRKRKGIFTKTDYETNYFKMIGWDGYAYPFAINLDDIQPKTGRFHLPPSEHLTFSGEGFAVMSFLPRALDFDDNAIPCPFYHSSVDCDELLLYVSDDFTSRKGVGKGSISYHPSGIPHGPHPGAYKNSIGKKHTQEKAIMVDTYRPLQLTEESRSLEDLNYIDSWKETVS
jgi:homogentisate 1,2-dioxygenase